MTRALSVPQEVGACKNMVEVESILAVAAETGPVAEGSHLALLREAYLVRLLPMSSLIAVKRRQRTEAQR